MAGGGAARRSGGCLHGYDWLGAPARDALGLWLLDHFHPAESEGPLEVFLHRGIDISPERQDEQIRIDELERGIRRHQRIAEIRRAAQAAVLECADQSQISTLVEESEGGQPWVLQDGHRRLAGSQRDLLTEAHDGDQWRTQGLGDDWEIFLLPGLAQGVKQKGVMLGESDGGGDGLATGSRVRQEPPSGLPRINRGV